MNRKIFGDFLLVLGICMILFAFYEGYAVFNANFSSNGTVSTASSNATDSIIITAVESLLPTKEFAYGIIKVLVLFLFGSLGYKISSLGIEVNSRAEKG